MSCVLFTTTVWLTWPAQSLASAVSGHFGVHFEFENEQRATARSFRTGSIAKQECGLSMLPGISIGCTFVSEVTCSVSE